MGRSRVIPEAVRRRIVAEARKKLGTVEGSARQLAKRHGVSESTVRRIVAEDSEIKGFGSEETRAAMKSVTEALKLSIEQRRKNLAEAFLREAERSLEDARAERFKVFNFGGKDNTFEMREIDFVPTNDRRLLVTTAAIAADKHKMLDQYDSDEAHGAAVDAWLRSMTHSDDSDDA